MAKRNSLLDTTFFTPAVIKMEGGSDLDLLCLEKDWREEQRGEKDMEDSSSFHTDESKKLAEQGKLKEVSLWLCSYTWELHVWKGRRWSMCCLAE